MSTWIKFYIKTNDYQGVIDQLKSFISVETQSISKFPLDHHGSFLIDGTLPNYLVIGTTEPEWITVIYNSSSKLEVWGTDLSKKFETIVIVTMAQSVDSYYYFALYEKGELMRELEYCYSDDMEPTNFGNKFSFEREEPGEKVEYEGEISYLFGFENIEEYCKHFGLTIQVDYDKFVWTILKGKSSGKTLDELLNDFKKPWWKFW